MRCIKEGLINYSIRELTKDEFNPLFYKFREEVFSTDHSYVLWDILDKEELEKTESLRFPRGTLYSLYLAVFDSEENFIAWSFGFQENNTTFYMCNSAVLKPYRREGIYTALLEKTISLTKDRGFQVIYSRHCATNNSVIIPKLKAGFTISKMELDDVFGVLIHLSYYTNKTRRKILDYRCGQRAPDDEIRTLFDKNSKKEKS